MAVKRKIIKENQTMVNYKKEIRWISVQYGENQSKIDQIEGFWALPNG